MANTSTEASALADAFDLDPDVAVAVEQAARSVGGRGVWLARVIQHESGWNPGAQFGYPQGPPGGVFLPGRATGLLQWSEGSAERLGTTTRAIFDMGVLDQLDLAEEYLSRVMLGEWAGGGVGPLDTLEKLALAVFRPADRNKPLSTLVPPQVAKVNGVKTLGEYVAKVLRGSESSGVLLGELAEVPQPFPGHQGVYIQRQISFLNALAPTVPFPIRATSGVRTLERQTMAMEVKLNQGSTLDEYGTKGATAAKHYNEGGYGALLAYVRSWYGGTSGHRIGGALDLGITKLTTYQLDVLTKAVMRLGGSPKIEQIPYHMHVDLPLTVQEKGTVAAAGLGLVALVALGLYLLSGR